MKTNFYYNTEKTTIVTPTYEKHYYHFYDFIKSINEYCLDKDKINIIVVIEKENINLFSKIKEYFNDLNIVFIFTEDVLKKFSLNSSSAVALNKIGKFTFQSLKKIGGLLEAETKWSIVLDSETLFCKPFSIKKLVSDYEENRYVFYTETEQRGKEWEGSLVSIVTEQCSSILDCDSRQYSYMELIIWFFETEKVMSLFKHSKRRLKKFLSNASADNPIFDNVLYYMYLRITEDQDYQFIDISKAWKELVPDEISGRYDLNSMPFSVVGADHLSYTLRPSDIPFIEKFITHYKIPFFRAEPALINTLQYEALQRIPSLKAFVSSSHIPWLKKRIAICISGEFRDQPMVFSKIRHAVGFLTGCDCDIYIHGWRNPDEAVIIENLKPKSYLFEETPRNLVNEIEKNIFYKEINLKPHRDQNSLLMFYGMYRAFQLVEESNIDYDFVVRIRPDIYSESSLLEIFRHITLESDPSSNTIFVPRHYHSQGINDQLAVGGINAMRIYMRTFSFIRENIKNIYFNPENILLKNLLENNIDIFLFNCHYALMREETYTAENIARILSLQKSIWWSSSETIPEFRNCVDFFSDKSKCIDFLKKRTLQISDIFVSCPGIQPHILSASWRDGNPNADLRVLTSINSESPNILKPINNFFTIRDEKIIPSTPFERYIFCYIENGNFIIVEWKYEKKNFIRNTLVMNKKYIEANYIK